MDIPYGIPYRMKYCTIFSHLAAIPLSISSTNNPTSTNSISTACVAKIDKIPNINPPDGFPPYPNSISHYDSTHESDLLPIRQGGRPTPPLAVKTLMAILLGSTH
jgi:hypothetical protein